MKPPPRSTTWSLRSGSRWLLPGSFEPRMPTSCTTDSGWSLLVGGGIGRVETIAGAGEDDVEVAHAIAFVPVFGYHRINLTLYKLPQVIAGEALGELIDALTTEHQAAQLAAQGAAA